MRGVLFIYYCCILLFYSGVCYKTVHYTDRVSYQALRTVSYGTSTKCGFLRWKRCRVTKYVCQIWFKYNNVQLIICSYVCVCVYVCIIYECMYVCMYVYYVITVYLCMLRLYSLHTHVRSWKYGSKICD